MKIVMTSDSHEYPLDYVPDGDVFLYAGDATYRGTVESITSFNKKVGKLNHKHKFMTPGNHDWLFQRDYNLAKALVTNCETVIDNQIEIQGTKIWMSPWSKMFYDWAFMREESGLRDIFDAIPEGIDILVTHGPPYGILDKNKQGEHCGSQALRSAVNRIKPKYHIFGHIHEDSGTRIIAGTTFINVSRTNDAYDPINPAVVIEI